MSLPQTALRLLLAGLSVFCLTGCQDPASTSTKPGTELAIHELKEITDRAEVERLAADILPGVKPLPGDVGLVALDADGLTGVVIAPEGWAQPGAKPKSNDIMTFVMRVPDRHKRFKEPLTTKLRAAVAARIMHAPTKPSLMQPFILKPGGLDYPGQKVDSTSANGMKAAEYWLELPQQDGKVYIQAATLPGFANFFPIERFAQFLLQLPKPNQGNAPATPATPAP